MSQPDFLDELRRARPAAPPELRERVLELAATRPPSRRRITWRRALIVAIPAMLAVAAAAIVTGRHSTQRVVQHGEAVRGSAPQRTLTLPQNAASGDVAIAPSPSRLQDYDAYLRLRVHDPDELSAATKKALAIARRLGGHASSVSVSVAGGQGDATLRLRIPIGHVQEAVARLSALGRITAENVSIRDVQPGVDATDRQIARLQKQLRDLRAEPQTPPVTRRIAALTSLVERLQRGRASTVHTARLATVSVELTTRKPAPQPKHHHPGPLDGAFDALRWIGVAALYGLIVGGPFVLLALAGWVIVRKLRRRAEDRLLGG
jgi:hypothetical protein